MKVVFATKNAGKLKELKELSTDLKGVDFELAPAGFDPEETGSSFLENAMIKAREAALMTSSYALADDSGITVEVLDGQPGIYSARYCEGTDADRRRKLMAAVGDAADRRCAFVCAMALAAPDGEIIHSSVGRWHGEIGFEEQGENGFGYDPIFWLPDKKLTAAQLSGQEKNRLSHRAQAWQQIMMFLQSRIGANQ